MPIDKSGPMIPLPATSLFSVLSLSVALVGLMLRPGPLRFLFLALRSWCLLFLLLLNCWLALLLLLDRWLTLLLLGRRLSLLLLSRWLLLLVVHCRAVLLRMRGSLPVLLERR